MKYLILALLLVGCVHKRAAPVPDNRFALPDSVHTTVGAIPVVLGDNLGVGDSTIFVLGRFFYLQRTIYISSRITDPLLRLKTLYHELCHVELLESGLHRHIPPDIIELTCDAIATNRVAAIVRGSP